MTCQEFWNTFPEPGDPESADGALDAHASQCAACAVRLGRQRELKAGLRAVAAGFRRLEAPPRVEARLLTAFRRQAGNESLRHSRRWLPAATWAVAFAAMFALAAFLMRPRQPEAARPPAQRTVELAMAMEPVLQPQADADGFFPLPNSAAAGDSDADDVDVVRVEVPRSAMIALGLDVSADRAGELVEADVMLGSNGIARAVRFLD